MIKIKDVNSVFFSSRRSIFSANINQRYFSVMFFYVDINAPVEPAQVPEGQYFMMGDNHYNSADSRFVGFVKQKFIVGRATKVVISSGTLKQKISGQYTIQRF